jgi:hypothetical protein
MLKVYFKGFCQLGAPPLEPAQYVALCQCAMRDDHPNQAFRLVEVRGTHHVDTHDGTQSHKREEERRKGKRKQMNEKVEEDTNESC